MTDPTGNGPTGPTGAGEGGAPWTAPTAVGSERERWLQAGRVAAARHAAQQPAAPAEPAGRHEVSPRPAPPAPADTTSGSTAAGSLWLLGAHGGAGVSTLAGLDDGWIDAGRAWPARSGPGRSAVVIVARTHARGLLAARSLLAERAAGEAVSPAAAPAAAEVLGLVLVADAPGRLPKPLRQLVDHVSGAAAHVWHLGWLPELRFVAGETASNSADSGADEQLPRELQRLVDDLTAAAIAAAASQNHR